MGELTAPRQGDTIKPSDLIGHLLIVRPTEYLVDMTTTFGKTDAVRVDIADLNATAPNGDWGVIYRDALWFNRMLLALRKQIGENVCGWMAQGVGKAGQDPPFQLTDAMANPEAAKVAQQWLNAHPDFELAPTSAPQAPATATQVPLPVPGAVQIPVGNAGVLGNTVPAPAAAPIPVPNALPVPGAPAASALASLSAEQKAALAALGFPL